MTLSLPPFTRAVTWLLAINTAVFLLLELFGMTLIDVVRPHRSDRPNLSILKNSPARAIRFNTLTAICDALGCTPGESLGLQR